MLLPSFSESLNHGYMDKWDYLNTTDVSFRKDFEPLLRNIADKYHVRICIGDELYNFSRLQPMWHICNNLLDVCSRIPKHQKNQLIYSHNFNALSLIDFASKYFCNQLGYSDIAYMIIPELFMLKVYDASTGSDYYEVLTTFFKLGQNYEKTARKLFMHRNTVSNKISKALSIVNLDLDDLDTQFNIMVSMVVIEYSEVFNNKIQWDTNDDGTPKLQFGNEQ